MGFACAIMKQAKSNLIVKLLVNLKNVSQFGLFIEIYKYEVRIKSNDILEQYRENKNFICTSRPSSQKNLF